VPRAIAACDEELKDGGVHRVELELGVIDDSLTHWKHSKATPAFNSGSNPRVRASLARSEAAVNR
jgi:hypothetical protein